MTKTTAWYARRYVERFGMHLVPIEPGRKFPVSDNWGNSCLTDPDNADLFYVEHAAWNMGVALGPSGFCSLDIDCLDSFRIICESFGIDLDDLLTKTPTIQGASKGMRMMFRVPADSVLPYQKLNWPREDEPARKYTVFELRSATDGKQRQDVLPPSIHPDTKQPYKWLVQPREEWPEPPKWLLAMWENFASFKPQMNSMCPWDKTETPLEYTATRTAPRAHSDSAIDAYISATPLHDALRQYGYAPKGKRWLSPHSSTGLPGVTVFSDGMSCWIHHASDPLCSEDNGKPVNAFDLYCYYEHGNDVSKAVKQAAKDLGLAKPARLAQHAPAKVNGHEAPVPGEPGEPVATVERSGPFRALGYNGNTYYYLPAGTEQVTEIKRGGHTSPAELMALASIEWWEAMYPKKTGTDWQLAASECMRQCERAGIYSHDRERGRGAWFDDGRPVLHLGNKLLVDGTATAISDHASAFIYTKQAPIEIGVAPEPAPDALAIQISDMFERLNWNKPIHAIYTAGFCALAPICGGLKWRPHLWLTAPRGAGKSWIQDHMIGQMLGPGALIVQGGTSEAGIRQSLNHDARPIVFDEAESEDARSQGRMQSVIELARQSSSDSTAQIVKGTVNGSGMTFRMRSMFMLGSINVALSQAADESRFTVVTINAPEKNAAEIERFNQFALEVDNLFTNSNCAAIRGRMFRMMPLIRANAKSFATAVAEKLGSQRIGDQVGTLIAGWYALRSSNPVAVVEARQIVASMDFTEAQEAEQVSDEESCLNRIMQSQVRFDSSEGQKIRSIGELCACAAGKDFISGLSAKDANDILGRHGLKIEGQWFYVANQHAELSALLRNTAWAAGWKRILSRIDGASPAPEAVRFAGSRSRATRIPVKNDTF